MKDAILDPNLVANAFKYLFDRIKCNLKLSEKPGSVEKNCYLLAVFNFYWLKGFPKGPYFWVYNWVQCRRYHGSKTYLH